MFGYPDKRGLTEVIENRKSPPFEHGDGKVLGNHQRCDAAGKHRQALQLHGKQIAHVGGLVEIGFRSSNVFFHGVTCEGKLSSVPHCSGGAGQAQRLNRD
ncbi:hypothetical protein D3C79_902490 [compost metagenome]